MFQKLKFKYFGHDAIVLHEHEIRKQKNDFKILVDDKVRNSFMNELSNCLYRSPFRIMNAVISKPELKYELFPDNPYNISLSICLQQAYIFLKSRKQEGFRTHFVFEKRGLKEDNDLELEFRRIISGVNGLRIPFPMFEIHFSDKRTNSTGMQIADLTARPLGLKILRPNQLNRAFDIIKPKLLKNSRLSQTARGIYVL